MTAIRPPGHVLEIEDRVRPVDPGRPTGGARPPGNGLLRKPWVWVTLVVVAVLAVTGVRALTHGDSAAPSHTVVVAVTGTAPTASVTYTTAARDQEQRQDAAALPFSRALTVRAIAATASISATVPAGSTGTVSCSITIDGKVVASNTSSGTSTTVACTGYAEGNPGDVPAGSP